MKIPFDIKYRPQIENGEYKVEDRNGRPVRIICWDKKSEKKYGYHIVALIEFGPQHEESTYFTIDGKGRLKDKEPELFIIKPEPELTEFEMRIKQLMGSYPCATRENKGSLIYEVRKAATELLELAKKELCESGEVTDWYAKGKAEALKDLPRWKRAAASFGNYSVAPTETGALCLLIDGHYIMLSELMKLPGFND